MSVISNDDKLENLPLMTASTGSRTLRIEEVPTDQLTLSDNDMLVPCAHFHQVGCQCLPICLPVKGLPVRDLAVRSSILHC